MRTKIAILILALSMPAAGCATVKPWQRGRLATAPMEVQDCPTHRFERDVEAYREGAVGATGGESGGGCGCS
jgi:hypothetical protein